MHEKSEEIIRTVEGLDKAPIDKQLYTVLKRLAAVKRRDVDLSQLKYLSDDLDEGDPAEMLHNLLDRMDLAKPKRYKKLTKDRCPLLFHNGSSWGIIMGYEQGRGWIAQQIEADGSFSEFILDEPNTISSFWQVGFTPNVIGTDSPSLRLILGMAFKNGRPFFEIAIAGFVMMIMAVSVSLFSMQVYDRVIPAGATETLTVLIAGVSIILGFELLLRFARSGVVERLTDAIDQSLAQSVMARFLSIRLEAMPTSVGKVSQTLRGYESARAFLVALFSTLMVDIPVSLFLMFVVWLIGGKVVFVPMTFFLVGLLMAFRNKKRSEQLAANIQDAHSRKTGIMVEVVEAAETIKANGTSWRQMSKWLEVSDEARLTDVKFKRISEDSQFILTFFHQLSYALTVTVGALLVISGEMTFGGLIGCSILTGRILTPISQIPNLVTQWANTKMSLRSLDAYWSLQQELPDQNGVFVNRLNSSIEFRDVRSNCHGPESLVLDIKTLRIQAGEKIAILGAVGSGKSSFLRLLSGLNVPTEGAVFIGDFDTRVLPRSTISKHIGVVHQDGRLVSGTLRDNFVLGIPDPGDQKIIDVAKILGAYDLIIKPAKKGLDLPLSESGAGLSGGQKQLVQLVRAFLKEPDILIMDEPTASLDARAEETVFAAIEEFINSEAKEKTLIFTTHKPNLLKLAERVIVIDAGRIVLDGPRDAVINRLQQANSGKKHAK
jgi:ATP-binding cassette subfamily C protein LapB